MKKILLLIILLIPIKIYALELPATYSPRVIVYDLTDDVIRFERNSNERVSIASLTKILTSITAINRISNFDETVVITQEMLSQVRYDASVAGLKLGDSVTVNDLLYACMLPSGADACTALAYKVSGGIMPFVDEMNKVLSTLGTKNMHVVNVIGLDAEGHYGTVNDVLTVLKYALKNDRFRKIYTTKKYTLTNGLLVKSTIGNFSKKVGKSTKRIVGSKTGLTNLAGSCLSFLFKSHGHEIIGITTGATFSLTDSFVVRDALGIIDFMDKSFNNQVLLSNKTVLKSYPLEFFTIDSYDAKIRNNVTLYLPNDFDKSKISYEYSGLESLDYSHKKGTKIGKVKVMYDNELISEETVYLDTTFRFSIFKIIKKYYYYFIAVVLFILFIFILIIKKIVKRH